MSYFTCDQCDQLKPVLGSVQISSKTICGDCKNDSGTNKQIDLLRWVCETGRDPFASIQRPKNAE